MKVIVIGAGPAGLTAAYQLAKRGVEVDLFEESGQVGGMAATFALWDQRVDYGPHRFFSSDPRVNAVWLEAVDGRYAMVPRLTRIFYKQRFFCYPLRAVNAFLNLGVAESVRCLFSYMLERVLFRGKRDEGTFEGWVISRFGRRLYEIFFQAYSEKLWGIPCDQLDADFAAQRIKKFSLFEALKTAFFFGKKNEHKTLVDEFAYPLDGSGYVYERMSEYVSEHGGHVYFRRAVRRVLVEGGRAVGIECDEGETFKADHIVSSMPLTDLVKGMDAVPPSVVQACERLGYRNTIIVYLRLRGSRLFPDNWLYVHDPLLRTGRITNYRNWVPSLYGEETSTIVALEYWCHSGDDLWQKDERSMVELATCELAKTGLCRADCVLDGSVKRLPRSYPVYRRGYKQSLAVVQGYVRTISGLSVVGRYGAFKYNNQDHSILMGLLAAENIVGQAAHDLWEINTDYEYQESAVITKTGLVRL